MTSSERLAQIQADLLQPDAGPQIARRHLVTLTAMWGDFIATARAADLAYKHVLKRCRSEHKAANIAVIEAETSPEYAAMREAKDNERYVDELIKSCKAAMKSIDSEMQLGR
jgi:glycerol kinase